MIRNRATITIGLISDTHFGERLFDLPKELFEIWKNISLILHAGDIGDKNVLDQLGKIAPVVAVHGNDEPEATKYQFPNKQIISIYGHKILLWHSHYEDPKEEKARRIGLWGPKLDRIAALGENIGADIVVYGHTHVPMISNNGKTILINPGALASGSFFTRQRDRSVGLLSITDDCSIEMQLLDLTTGMQRKFPEAKPSDSFNDLADKYQEWIVGPEFILEAKALMKINYEDVRSVVQVVHPLYQRYILTGELQRVDLIEAFRSANSINPIDKGQILSILADNNH
jgi:putative phosphoesterase